MPTLVALAVNSPFRDGRDTGYASWRIVALSRFPGAGLLPWCGSAQEYTRQVARLLDLGVLVDDRMTFRLARPSPRYPTVELRAADTGRSADDAILQAVLTRGLVHRAIRDLAAGRDPRIDAQVGAAAVWSAARYGLEGAGVDVVAETSVPARNCSRRCWTPSPTTSTRWVTAGAPTRWSPAFCRPIPGPRSSAGLG